MAAFHKNDDHSYKVLMAVKKRPGMYIYPVSLESLGNFIAGYAAINLFSRVLNSALFSEFPSFYDWIAMKESTLLSPSKGWIKVISKNSASEEEAFEKFFNYFEQYVEREPFILHHFDVFIDRSRQEPLLDFDHAAKAEIISYDKDILFVFTRFFDIRGNQIGEERLFKSFESAMEYLQLKGVIAI